MFIVMEIQKNDDGAIGTLVNSYEDEGQAQSKYHSILSAAAISSLPCHSAVILDERGMCLNNQFYIHGEKDE